MDFFMVLAMFLLILLTFHFNLVVNIMIFLFMILSFFKFFKTWLGLMVLMVYLGGLLILMIYITSFSKKKSFSWNPFVWMMSIAYIFLWEEKKVFNFSFSGFDVLTSFSALWLMIFILIMFVLLLFCISEFCPQGKSLRSL